MGVGGGERRCGWVFARSEESVGVGGTGGGSMDDGRGRMEWAEERESQSPTHLPTGWLVCAEEHGVVAAWAAVRERLVELTEKYGAAQEIGL